MEIYFPPEENENIAGINYWRYRRIYIFTLPTPAFVFDIVAGQKYRKTVYCDEWFDRGMCLLRRFSSLPFGLQITLRCIYPVFQSPAIYVSRNHMCFSCESRKLNNFLATPYRAQFTCD